MQSYEHSDLDPPCDTCRPELKECNAPYFKLYNYCRDQVIMGPAGAVALNGLFIKVAMEDFLIDHEEHIEFSTKVRQIASTVFAAQYEEAETKRKQSKR